jgi:hypothetical protein
MSDHWFPFTTRPCSRNRKEGRIDDPLEFKFTRNPSLSCNEGKDAEETQSQPGNFSTIPLAEELEQGVESMERSHPFRINLNDIGS